MSIKHTPGPWRMYEGNRGSFVFYGIADVADMSPAYVRQESDDAATMKANAQLIAAAPELLESLKEVLYYIGDRKVTTLGAMIRARAAIAKAEGRTS